MKENEVSSACGTHERGQKCTWFWWESSKERVHLIYQGVDGRMGSKWTLGRLAGCVCVCVCVWSGFTWLRIGTVGRPW
jgi:hypothetical protein